MSQQKNATKLSQTSNNNKSEKNMIAQNSNELLDAYGSNEFNLNQGHASSHQ
jgi:hypothetical protein